jgi:hypothetical protein
VGKEGSNLYAGLGSASVCACMCEHETGRVSAPSLLTPMSSRRQISHLPLLPCPAPPHTQLMQCRVIGIGIQRDADFMKLGRVGKSMALWSCARAARGLLGLLSTNAHAFEEVFVAAYELLDMEWLNAKASYMAFGPVILVRGGGGGVLAVRVCICAYACACACVCMLLCTRAPHSYTPRHAPPVQTVRNKLSAELAARPSNVAALRAKLGLRPVTT